MGLILRIVTLTIIILTSGCMSPRQWEEIYQGQGPGLRPGEAFARYNK